MTLEKNGIAAASAGHPQPVRPRISVCMATFNGEKYIGRQLETILSQLAPDDEVVISDDSSSDRTLPIVEGLCDSRIVLLKHQKFSSPTYNFEHALKCATGDFIFLADQDDEWETGWVDIALTELCSVSLVVCDISIIDAEGRRLRRDEKNPMRRRYGIIWNLYRNSYMGCCCAFRRELLEVVLPFPPRLPWHDWWIGLIAESFFTSKFIENKCIRYRRHGANASPTGEHSNSTFSQKLRMRWNIGTQLLRRRLGKQLRGYGPRR